MTVRRLSYATGAFVLISSGVYVFTYLYRWEWNRALFAAAVFIAAEVALLGLWTIERLARLERSLDEGQRAAAPDPEVLGRLREAAPPDRDHFAWLDPTKGQTSVFVPILMGAGVVVSGLSWLVERVARSTARPALERRLATRLSRMAWPAGGLLAPDPPDPLDLLHGPAP